MRTVVACVVLAAAIAAPGIVVAATSSERHSAAPIGYGATIMTPSEPRGPINPSLRPTVNAVKAAFAAKNIELTVQPLGGEAATGFAITPADHCPIVVVFSLEHNGGNLGAGTCSSEGSTQTADGLTITYTPASVGSTIDEALATLSR